MVFEITFKEFTDLCRVHDDFDKEKIKPKIVVTFMSQQQTIGPLEG